MSRLFVTVLLLTCSVISFAADLSATHIEGYIQSVGALKQWNNEFERPVQEAMESSAAAGQIQRGNPYEAVRAGLETAGLLDQFATIVADYGFSSADAYFDVADRVLRAYLSFQMAEQDLDSRVQETLQKLENSELPPAQKQQMMAMIQSQIGMVANMTKSTPEDKAAVQPFLQRLDSAFRNP